MKHTRLSNLITNKQSARRYSARAYVRCNCMTIMNHIAPSVSSTVIELAFEYVHQRETCAIRTSMQSLYRPRLQRK